MICRKMSIPIFLVDKNPFFIYAICMMNKVKVGNKLYEILSRTDRNYILSYGGKTFKSPKWLIEGICRDQGEDFGIRRLSGGELGCVESYICELVDQFANDHRPVVVEFTANLGSCCYRGHNVEIRMGTRGEGAAMAYRVRFTEYVSVAPHILGNQIISGMEAIHYLTIHELAHALQSPEDPHHGGKFIRFYKNLLGQYPFVRNIL